MAREIEIKIPLSDEEYSFLFDFVHQKKNVDGVSACKNQKITKNDEYWSRYASHDERKASGEPQVIRIREEEYDDDGNSKKAFFCIKRKSLENGIELNAESETFVQNADVIRDLLAISGYHKWFEKKKEAFSVYCKCESLLDADFHLELEVVNGLKYAEIEVTESNESADKVKCALGEFVKRFGLNPQKKDSRSWKEIIEAAM